MASRVAPSVLDELNDNARRGLWFVEFDPAGGQSDTKSRSGPGPRASGGPNGVSRLGLHLLGEPHAHHPAVARRGSVEAVFAGHLLNREELVERRGARSKKRSDADLILEAYRERGPEFLSELRGFFCLVVSDGERNSLLAARDHLGVSPLFMAELPGRLVFSTAASALLLHPDVPATLNRPYILDQLRHSYPDHGETHFSSVRRIMPGHALAWNRGDVAVARYWEPLPSDRPVEWLSEDEMGEFGDLMDQAVSRCLRIGPAGIFLSGGLDSVSVAAMATDISLRLGMPAPLALSLGFTHPTVDERETQRRVADQLGLPIVLLQLEEAVGELGLLLTDLEMCRHWPTPLLNPWLPAYCRLGMEGAAQGRKVILTGGGGDEWLTVGSNYAADLFRTGDLRGLKFVWNMWKNTYRLSDWALLRSLLKFGLMPPTKMAAKRAMRAIAPGSITAWKRWQARRSMTDWLAPDPTLRAEALEREAARPEEELLFSNERLSYYLTDGRHAVDHVVVSMESEEDHEVGRRLGFQEADPYWDPDLVPFLYRTPPELLLRGGRGKGLVRWMLSERFPGLGFESQKKMVSLDFFQSVILRDAPRAWRRLGGVQALDDLGIVNALPFERVVQDIVRGRRSAEAYRIWDVLTMEAWARARL